MSENYYNHNPLERIQKRARILEEGKTALIKKHILNSSLLPNPKNKREEESRERKDIKYAEHFREIQALFNSIYVPQDLRRFLNYAKKQRLQDTDYQANKKNSYKKDHIAITYIQELLEDERLTKYLSTDDIQAIQELKTRREADALYNMQSDQEPFYHAIREGVLQAIQEPQYVKLNKQYKDHIPEEKMVFPKQSPKKDPEKEPEEVSKEEQQIMKKKETFERFQEAFGDLDLREGGKKISLFEFDEVNYTITYIAGNMNPQIITIKKTGITFADYAKAIVDIDHRNIATSIPKNTPRKGTKRYFKTFSGMRGPTKIVSGKKFKAFCAEVCEKFGVTFINGKK